MTLRTPDQHVRPQIEAIKAYLAAEGLREVEELRTKTSEGYHTIRSTVGEHPRLLRLGYGWLEEHPDAITWLHDKWIADRLKSDNAEIWIHDDGQITSGLTPQ